MLREREALHTVLIDAAEDGAGLCETLISRGLDARLAEDTGEVEVAAVGEEGIWNLEVMAALEAWLEETGHEELTARVGETIYTVRAPRDDLVPERRRRRAVDIVAIGAGIGAAGLLAAGVWLLVVAATGGI